jgi:hypothetical protein
MRSQKMQTWVAIFVLAAALIGGAWGVAYLKTDNFKTLGDRAETEKSIRRLLDEQANINGRLNQLEIDYEYQRAAIENLSKNSLGGRTWFDQALTGYCLNPSDRLKVDYCSEVVDVGSVNQVSVQRPMGTR